jgi:hypothetical protein
MHTAPLRIKLKPYSADEDGDPLQTRICRYLREAYNGTVRLLDDLNTVGANE